MIAMMKTRGAFITMRTQRPPSDGFAVPSPSCSAAARARRCAREPALGTRRPRATPMIAGMRVTAMLTATSTANAAPTPMTDRNGMPTTSRPSSAMITVTPANTTAPPAVATACAADSSGSSPCASCDLCRDRMKSA